MTFVDWTRFDHTEFRCTGFGFTRQSAQNELLVGNQKTNSFISSPRDKAMRIKCLGQGHNCHGRDSNRVPIVSEPVVSSTVP